MILNYEQLRASTIDRPRVACMAGAGTGKTRVLTARIVHLLRKGVPGHRILAFTFTRKAAAELVARVNAALVADGIEAEYPEVCTVHTWATRVIRVRPGLVGRTERFAVYDETEAAVLRASCKNSQGEYLERLRAADALDFLGIEQGALTVLRADPQEFRRRYDHVLLDEAQDSGPFEAELLRLLDPPNLFLVGDTRQAIYGFRGATGELLWSTLASPEWEKVDLVTNYRSGARIVDWANTLAERWIGPLPNLQPGLGFEGAVHIGNMELLASTVSSLQTQHGADNVVVLGRTWADLTRAAQMLQAAGVPVTFMGGKEGPEWRILRQVYRWLHLLRHPYDDNLAAWFLSSITGCSVDALLAEATKGRTTVLATVATRFDLGEARTMAMAALHASGGGHGIQGPLVADLVEAHFPQEAARRLAAALRAEHVHLADLDSWLLARNDEAERAGGTELVTVHAYKGLEAEAVVVIGVDLHRYGTTPEDARVLYVAATRARRELVLLHGATIHHWRRATSPSPLLGLPAPDAPAPDSPWGGDPW